jgi:hypothetical protein
MAVVPGGLAEQGGVPAEPTDPRVGLKAGLRDAGVAARHMELVASVSKPDGFFDPAVPAATTPAPENSNVPQAAAASSASPARRPLGDLNFANSDLAFGADLLFGGSFHGFNIFTIEDPTRPRLLASIVCPGGQGDVSIHGRLLFMSVEQTRGRVDCGNGGVHGLASAERFRGVRIFDVSDVRAPKQLAAVQTCRGSHTHTLVVDPRDSANVYIYGSGTGSVRFAEELAGCSRLKPDEDSNTALASIDVIQVPLAAPERARIVNRPRIFADAATGAISGLWQGGDHGPATQTTSATNACHDITVMPAVGLAVGACSGNGILLDISDPVRPVRLDQVTDQNFAYWHSATFNNDATKVIFTDEWGGGTRPRCRASDNQAWGADAIFEVVDRKLRFGGYYKMPAPQTEQENCVAHNGSIVPVPGRDIMVQAWYQGGISVFDFTDAAQPVEIAFFDRGPIDANRLVTGGYWSAYWRNGYVYGAEIARGLDVFRLTPSEHLTRNEIEAAALVSLREFNAQHQPRLEWPAATVVARAYLDQLGRTNAVLPRRAAAVRSALDRVDRVRPGQERDAVQLRRELESLAAELKRDAGTADGRDATRLESLAATLRSRATTLGAR